MVVGGWMGGIGAEKANCGGGSGSLVVWSGVVSSGAPRPVPRSATALAITVLAGYQKTRDGPRLSKTEQQQATTIKNNPVQNRRCLVFFPCSPRLSLPSSSPDAGY